jgi:hypothetical protein
MLEPIDESLWTADGASVPFFGFPYPTRMVVVRLADGGLWVWSPIDLDEQLARAIDDLGPVAHLVSPNKLHHIFLGEWTRRWPDAKLWAPPGLAKRKPELHFDAELGDQAEAAWANDLDQVIVRGSFAMEEVVFFHRQSRTAIVGDLVQRFDPASLRGWRLAIMKLDGMVGPRGSTPREWRLTFWRRSAARAARDKVLAWQPRRLVIAHGECADSDAAAVLQQALSWM